VPLNHREIALSFAVLTFFLISIIGTLQAVAPEVCCKRAIIGLFCTYFVVSIAVKIINYLVIDAMVSKQVDKVMDKFRNTNDGTN
jgi:hypothetical protein